jgi:hypothetical protein
MHRISAAWRTLWRGAPDGTFWLGLAMIAVIWVATAFHLVTFKRQLYESYRQNAANLARAFEQDVVHALHSTAPCARSTAWWHRSRRSRIRPTCWR